MWRNEKLGPWAYFYHDVSWVLTLGWTTLILGTVTLVDRLLPKWGEGRRFALSLLVLLPVVLVAENVVVALGIRGYAPEVQEVLSGYRIGVAPVEALYYVPVFTALVIAFAKYWSFVIDDPALVPPGRRDWLRALGLTCAAVVLFEILVEPLVRNENLPVGQDLNDPAREEEWIDWSPFSYPFNMTRQPACSIPCGLTSAGLPIGLQIVGPLYAEDRVLRAARAFEQTQPERRPTLG